MSRARRPVRRGLATWAAIAVAWVILFGTGPAEARSIPAPVGPGMLSLRGMRVEVDVRGQVARTRIEQTFHNPSERPAEGGVLFPVPPGAVISDLRLTIDGEELGGELLEAGEARRIYEGIVRRQRDPALLEFAGHGLLRARVFPVPPGLDRKLVIAYAHVLERDAGLTEYRFPLRLATRSLFMPAGARPGDLPVAPLPEPAVAATEPAAGLQNLSFTLRIAGAGEGTAIYSPSHSVHVDRDRDSATVRFEASGQAAAAAAAQDFRVFHAAPSGDLGATLLSYRVPGEDGYFLMLVSPRAENSARPLPKDVVLVLDTSGSMAGRKIEQARSALRFVLDNLHDSDRFGIVAFDSVVRTFADQLMPASERASAREFVDRLQAQGGTNIAGALERALRLADGEAGRPQLIVFLTDGLPTVGPSDPREILRQAAAVAGASHRVFTFGVGDDVNTLLLDALAQEYRGAATYVRPGENLEETLAAFYRKVGVPVLADTRLEFRGVRVTDVYPQPLPDLFAGQQLVVLGRYTTEGNGGAGAELRGHGAGGVERRSFDGLRFAERDDAHDFIPRLWAARKIGYLLEQLRRNGEHKELVDEVTALSLRHGILTPYTSFFVAEPGIAFTQRGRDDLAKRAAASMTRAPASGSAAVNQSASEGKLRAAESLADAALAGGAGPGGSPASGRVRYAGEKTFLLKDGVWVDTLYPSGAPTIKVGAGSQNLLDIVAARPDWAKFFALGERVIAVLDGKPYEVAPGDHPPAPIPQARDTARATGGRTAGGAAAGEVGGGSAPSAPVLARPASILAGAGIVVIMAVIYRSRMRIRKARS